MTIAQIVNTPPATDTSISVWALAMAGGPLMIPIVLSSLVAIYIFVERLLTINKANESPDAFKIGRAHV